MLNLLSRNESGVNWCEQNITWSYFKCFINKVKNLINDEKIPLCIQKQSGILSILDEIENNIDAYQQIDGIKKKIFFKLGDFDKIFTTLKDNDEYKKSIDIKEKLINSFSEIGINITLTKSILDGKNEVSNIIDFPLNDSKMHFVEINLPRRVKSFELYIGRESKGLSFTKNQVELFQSIKENGKLHVKSKDNFKNIVKAFNKRLNAHIIKYTGKRNGEKYFYIDDSTLSKSYEKLKG